MICSTESFEIELFLHLTVSEQKTVLSYTELFEIELFFTFKMCTYAKLNCLK